MGGGGGGGEHSTQREQQVPRPGTSAGLQPGGGGLRDPGEDFPLTLNEAREGGVCHGRIWRVDLAV